MKRLGLAALLLVSSACGGRVEAARSQWRVVISTDAPVPELGDRLLIEVLDDAGKAACAGCRRQLGASDRAHWPVSFGIVPSAGAVRVRVRLFRTQVIGRDGTPGSDAVIDALARLPPLGDSPLEVSILLSTACFGVPASTTDRVSCDPATGALAPEREAPTTATSRPLEVGSWGPAEQVSCATAASAEMACIPGGAFLLGDPDTPSTEAAALASLPEHLVQISPFFLDRYELTVKDVKGVIGLIAGEPVRQNSLSVPDSKYCNWLGQNDATNDDLPINCLTTALARQICEALGKRLPTEAEWEFAAGNLGAETPYPWGTDANVCGHAIVGRGDTSGVTLCRITPGGTLPYGPVAGGDAQDTTSLGIVNMGGNVSEWVEDVFQSYSDTCWNQGTLLVDPVCHGPPDSAGRATTFRGGGWRAAPANAHPAIRGTASELTTVADIGVRCAR